MFSISSMLNKIGVQQKIDPPQPDRRPLMVLMSDGSLAYVRDVIVCPNKTGEMSIVFDTREMVQ